MSEDDVCRLENRGRLKNYDCSIFSCRLCNRPDHLVNEGITSSSRLNVWYKRQYIGKSNSKVLINNSRFKVLRVSSVWS
jgi:hypothetical protein